MAVLSRRTRLGVSNIYCYPSVSAEARWELDRKGIQRPAHVIIVIRLASNTEVHWLESDNRWWTSTETQCHVTSAGAHRSKRSLHICKTHALWRIPRDVTHVMHGLTETVLVFNKAVTSFSSDAFQIVFWCSWQLLNYQSFVRLNTISGYGLLYKHHHHVMLVSFCNFFCCWSIVYWSLDISTFPFWTSWKAIHLLLPGLYGRHCLLKQEETFYILIVTWRYLVGRLMTWVRLPIVL